MQVHSDGHRRVQFLPGGWTEGHRSLSLGQLSNRAAGFPVMSKRESQGDEQDTRWSPFVTKLEEVFRGQSQLDLVDTQGKSDRK